MKKENEIKNFNDKEKNIKAAAAYSTLLTSTQSRSDGEPALLLFQQAKLRQLRNAFQFFSFLLNSNVQGWVQTQQKTNNKKRKI